MISIFVLLFACLFFAKVLRRVGRSILQLIPFYLYPVSFPTHAPYHMRLCSLQLLSRSRAPRPFTRFIQYSDREFGIARSQLSNQAIRGITLVVTNSNVNSLNCFYFTLQCLYLCLSCAKTM